MAHITFMMELAVNVDGQKADTCKSCQTFSSCSPSASDWLISCRHCLLWSISFFASSAGILYSRTFWWSFPFCLYVAHWSSTYMYKLIQCPRYKPLQFSYQPLQSQNMVCFTPFLLAHCILLYIVHDIRIHPGALGAEDTYLFQFALSLRVWLRNLRCSFLQRFDSIR